MEPMHKLEDAFDQDHGAEDLALLALRASSSRSWPQLAGEKELVCQRCRARTTFNGTLTSTRCPYCVTPIERGDVHVAPGRLPIDAVVPFAVDPMMAKEAIETWINGRRFVPSRFKRYKQTGSFARIYASCFTYEGEARTVYEGRRGENDTDAVGSGRHARRETRLHWHHASGTVRNSFTDVCVLANNGFDRAKVQALEPWPTGKAKPISPEYVAGHLCRTHDHNVEESFDEARQQLAGRIEDLVRSDIGGDAQQIDAVATTFDTLTFKHLLMPLWLLTVTFERKPFQVFIDGVTGQVHGQRPLSKPKVFLAAVAAVAVPVASASAGAWWIARGS